MKSFLLGDDHAVVRSGLKQLLIDEFQHVNVGEAANGFDVLELARGQHWDVLILDINLPGRNGLDVLSELKKERTKPPVLVLSMHPEDQFAIRALKAGASGYLTKDAAPEELIRAVNKILAGGRYISDSLAERLASDLDGTSQRPPHELLSDREFQVLRLIGSGKTPGQIATELHLSIKTVSTFRSRILEKMNLKTNAELTRYAIENNLVI
jgi:two-component system, NarL family, invasion response regulator UvrY